MALRSSARTRSRVSRAFAASARAMSRVPALADRLAHDGRVIRPLGRAGVAAHGAVFLLVGVLAVLESAGVVGSRAAGVQESLAALARARFGPALVALLALGMLAYALWRFVEAAWDPARATPFFFRVGSLFPAAIFFVLALYAAGVAVLGTQRSGDEWVRSWIARLLQLPLGGFIVLCIGLGFLLTGVIQVIYVFTPAFARSLELRGVSTRVRHVASAISRFGIGSRGAVFAVVGLFLLSAGERHDPTRAQNIGGALEAIHGQRWGAWLLAAIGLGFVAYGVSRFFAARYRPFPVVRHDDRA